MRNCTATIATSVTLLAYRMSPDEPALINEVVEASYLLDLFDAGMDICFSHDMGKVPSYEDTYPLEPILLHFMDQCKSLMSERNIKLNLRIENPAIINAHVYELRTITNLIIYEMILQTAGKLSVSLKNKTITLAAEGFYDVPKVWEIFQEVLATSGVRFTYSQESCTLEFGV
jgi:hypothetical protein